MISWKRKTFAKNQDSGPRSTSQALSSSPGWAEPGQSAAALPCFLAPLSCAPSWYMSPPVFSFLSCSAVRLQFRYFPSHLGSPSYPSLRHLFISLHAISNALQGCTQWAQRWQHCRAGSWKLTKWNHEWQTAADPQITSCSRSTGIFFFSPSSTLFFSRL